MTTHLMLVLTCLQGHFFGFGKNRSGSFEQVIDFIKVVMEHLALKYNASRKSCKNHLEKNVAIQSDL